MASKLGRRISMLDLSSPLSTPVHGIKSLSARRSIVNVQSERDVGEMGYLQFHVKDLENVSDENMDLKDYRVLFTIDFVADSYSKVKTMVAKGEDGRMGLWGSGLFFRVFNANKEVSLEIKATASKSSRDAVIDFGSNRLSLVPALDTTMNKYWCVMQDRFGRRNSCRIQVSWHYVPKLNRVKPSILLRANPCDNALIFNGSEVANAERCSPLNEMIEKICSEGPSLDDDKAMSSILSLSRWFTAYKDTVFSIRLSRFLSFTGQVSDSEAMLQGKMLLMKRRAEVKAASKVQRIFRGHIGRVLLRFAKLSKRAYLAMLEVQTVRVRIRTLDTTIFGFKGSSACENELRAMIAERNDACDALGDKICIEQDLQVVYAKEMTHYSAYANLIQSWSPKFNGKTYRDHKTEEKRLQSLELGDGNSEEHESMPQQLPGLDSSAMIRGRFRRAGTVLFLGSLHKKKKSSINAALRDLGEALEEVADITSLNLDRLDFEKNPPPGAPSFTFKSCPSLVINEQDRTIATVRIRQALFAFLLEQIQRGAGILRTLDPSHDTVNSDDVMRLTDIATLQCIDPGQVLFEQNEDAESFGIVCAGFVRVLYNRREVSTLIRGQSFCDTGMINHIVPSVFGPAKYLRGATFIAAVRSFVAIFSFDKFAEHVKGLGPKCELSLKNFLSQSDSIGREDWSAYGNSAKSIEISFLYFMSTRSGLLGQLNMEEVRSLASCATYSKIKTNDFLCKQGERADGIFIILTGVSAVIVDEKQVAVISRGQEVGEMGLIGHFGRLRSATLQALYDCEVANISYENFISFMQLLSEHQAKRLAAYVASSALPKYLTNLSLRKAGEKEQQEERQRVAAMRRPSPDGSHPLRRRLSNLGQANHRPELDHRRRISLEGHTVRQARFEDETDTDMLSERSDSFRSRGSEARKLLFALDHHPPEKSKRRSLNDAPGSEEQDPDLSWKTQDTELSWKGREQLRRQCSGRSLKDEMNMASERSGVTMNSILEKAAIGLRHPSDQNDGQLGQNRIDDETIDGAQIDTVRDDVKSLHVTYDSNVETRPTERNARILDSLTEAARKNVKNRLKREMGQIFLIPPKKPAKAQSTDLSPHSCSSPLSKRLCKTHLWKEGGEFWKEGVFWNRPSEDEALGKIRNALRKAFTEFSSVLAYFDPSMDGYINIDALTIGLQRLDMDSSSLTSLLTRLKSQSINGKVSCASLTKILSWQGRNESTPQELLLSYKFKDADTPCRGDYVGNESKQLLVQAIEKNLHPVKLFFQDHESITLKEFRLKLLQIDIGLELNEINGALEILESEKIEKIQFSDVLQWITQQVAASHFTTPSPPTISQHRQSGDTLAKTSPKAREWHSGTKTESPPLLRPRPQTARARLNTPRAADTNAMQEWITSRTARRPHTAKARMKSQPDDCGNDNNKPLSGKDKEVLNDKPQSGKNKDVVAALWSRGHMHMLQGNYDDAAFLLRQALSVEPDNLNCLATYAQVLCEGFKDQGDEAVCVFDKMLDIEPRDSRTLSQYAALLIRLRRDRDKARRLLETAVKYDPMSPRLLCDYADFLARGGKDAGPERDRQVLALYERVLTIDRHHSTARQEAERLRSKLGPSAPPPMPAAGAAGMKAGSHLGFALQMQLSA